MITLNNSDIEIQEDILMGIKLQTEKLKDLVVYNDDVNTFEFVIESFIKICKHDKIQAEQCTYLVHYTGKCTVKRGTYQALEAICTALLDRGLTAEIE